MVSKSTDGTEKVELEVLQIRYDGEYAAQGKLHLYEFGRSQYALSRFIIAVESFRRTGQVLEKVSKANYVDMFVGSPQKGSFVEDIIVNTIANAAAVYVSVPLNALLSYIWHALSPISEKSEAVAKDVALTLKTESRSNTGELQSSEIKMALDVVKSQNATTQQALTLLDYVIKNLSTYSFSGEFSKNDLMAAKQDYESSAERESIFKQHEAELEKIDFEKFSRLTSRVRPMVAEMALPLKRSATSLTLGVKGSKRPVAFLDADKARAIQKRKIAEDESIIVAHVHGYDRDGGFGKFSSEAIGKTLTFTVSVRRRKILLPLILEAMKVDKVKCTVQLVKDESLIPTSAVLVDIDLQK